MISLLLVLSASPPHTHIVDLLISTEYPVGAVKCERDHATPIFRTFHQLPIPIKRKTKSSHLLTQPSRSLHLHHCLSSESFCHSFPCFPYLIHARLFAAPAYTGQSPTARTSALFFLLACSSPAYLHGLLHLSFSSQLGCHLFTAVFPNQHILHSGDKILKLLKKEYFTRRPFASPPCFLKV